jgi:Domain of unknown function (DUF4331)
VSSHREAPEISKDPVADNTDIYAFISPDKPSSVTIVANFIPFQNPQGGPNFYEFGDDVLYEINISNHEALHTDISYQFRFHTKIRNKSTFLYNTGPITKIDDTTWNRPQYYSVTRVERGKDPKVLGKDLTVPPVNVGVRSTPHYASTFTDAAVHYLGAGRRVFAGQRADAFNVDLGSIFDLGVLRPFQALHVLPSVAAAGVNGVQGLNVHTIAIQVPIEDLTRGKNHPKATDPLAVIGVWASASRKRIRMFDQKTGTHKHAGAYRQVSRLGNPLFNEAIVPMAMKDRWNADSPYGDSEYAIFAAHPELASLLPVLYPGVFPNLALYTKARADLLAILLTGIPTGVVAGFQNYTGPNQADMLRLNVGIPPTAAPNSLGLVAGDPAGFPNGRRIADDVVTVELRAIAGLTIGLVDPGFIADGAASLIKDGTTNTNNALLHKFPYLGTPGGGYQTVPGTATA